MILDLFVYVRHASRVCSMQCYSKHSYCDRYTLTFSSTCQRVYIICLVAPYGTAKRMNKNPNSPISANYYEIILSDINIYSDELLLLITYYDFGISHHICLFCRRHNSFLILVVRLECGLAYVYLGSLKLHSLYSKLLCMRMRTVCSLVKVTEMTWRNKMMIWKTLSQTQMGSPFTDQQSHRSFMLRKLIREHNIVCYQTSFQEERM